MRPRVAELVGLPGTGKSTLFNTLRASDPQRIAAVRLERLGHLPQVIYNALQLTVPFAAQYSRIFHRRRRRFSRMVQLATYYDLVAANRTTPPDLVLLDQGPVYLLSVIQRCLVPEPESNSRAFEKYWERTLARWAESLDLLVVLDGSDEVLYQRIQSRKQEHRIKGRDWTEASSFFQRARMQRDLILAALQRQKNAPAVIRMDTGSAAVPTLVAQLREILLAPELQVGRSRRR